MARSLFLAMTGVLAFATLSHAQYSSSGSSRLPPQRLMNSRYVPDPASDAAAAARERSLRTERLPEMAPRPSLYEDAYFRDDFKPLAFIDRVYLDVLGREPSARESSYWLLRLDNQSRRSIALELMQRRPMNWMGHYDPRYGSIRYPDPASLSFPDPSGPYFNSPYFPNYERSRPLRAFPLAARG